MCDFEDMDIIARYTRQQAVDDGVLVEVLRWKGRPVMATTNIASELGQGQLLDVWRQFQFWKDQEEPNLPEEERLFHTLKNNKKVWVIEDGEGFTIMYPKDY